jgi:hypothetical protein
MYTQNKQNTHKHMFTNKEKHRSKNKHKRTLYMIWYNLKIKMDVLSHCILFVECVDKQKSWALGSRLYVAFCNDNGGGGVIVIGGE